MSAFIRQRLRWRLGVGFCTGLALWLSSLGWSDEVVAQEELAPLSYTSEQADRGRLAYLEHCASCHGENMDDGEFAIALKGIDFRDRWCSSTSVEELFLVTSATIPQDRPGRLDDEMYADILAYVLQENGTEPGTEELTPGGQALLAMAPPFWARPWGGGLAPGVVLPPAPSRPNPLDRIRPVTDAMLHEPDDGDWLLWRRTYDGFGYSPLTQINTGNVDELRVAWTWSLTPGPNQLTPLVHAGVMFMHGYGDHVQVLDAVTGDLLWQYSHRLPQGVPPSYKRGFAIYGHVLYVPTSDMRIVALDAKTGAVIWDTAVADPEKKPDQRRPRLSGGPLMAKGNVIMGTNGHQPFIIALDAETGEEAWRFHPIALPGEPGGNSWNGLPLKA